MVVVGAVNEGYDTDTIAAIAGGLAGLGCGFEELPADLCAVVIDQYSLNEVSVGLNKLKMRME